MKIYEIIESKPDVNMNPSNQTEFNAAWDWMSNQADDQDDIQYYRNPQNKAEVLSIISSNGWRKDIASAITKHRQNMSKKTGKDTIKKPKSQTDTTTSTTDQKNKKKKKSKATFAEPEINPLKLPGKLGDLQKWAKNRIKVGTDIADRYTKTSKK